ncbi:MAG TPA: hypothetical protein VFE53_23470 [Mucilaginibacter sp.]|jgi:hypothetical protein|nr:hypothetical protein [Mucilaginibacter sp.]
MSNYWISMPGKSAKHDELIHDPDTKLKVKAIDLLKSRFKPRKGEVYYFVTSGQDTFAFETRGYRRQRKLLILHMIAWYCMYLGLLKAQIHTSWPR